ncbi:MAG: S8/S53 family peptidase, partial [Pseudomonadota bacterium]
MNIRPLLIMIAAVVLWSPPPPDAYADCIAPGDPTPEIPIDACIAETDGDADWRFLALHTLPDTFDGSTTPPCPSITGWAGVRLFDTGDDPAPVLLPYCRYTAVGEASSPAALFANVCTGSSDDPPGCFDEVQAERLVVTGQAGPGTTESILWQDFQQQFLEQSGAPGPLVSGTTNVRLAVVDTEPSGPGQELDGPGIADHGFGLMNMARDMVCNDTGPCDIQLASHIALPLQRCSNLPGASCPCSAPEPARTGFCTTPLAGGHLGSQGDVAAGVFNAMRAFETGGPARLVINLSLGWDPRYGGTAPLATAPLGVRAVRDALQYASCRGALVVAAAGNRVTGPESTTGPLMPGAWEGIAAPDQTECDALLGDIPFDPSLFANTGGYRPLLYAAGSVDERSEQQRVRTLGEPPLTAFGDHGIGDWIDGGVQTPTGFLTGTSVGSLVVATSAAAAWHFRPNAPAYEIMAAVYASGINLQRQAQFCQEE